MTTNTLGRRELLGSALTTTLLSAAQTASASPENDPDTIGEDTWDRTLKHADDDEKDTLEVWRGPIVTDELFNDAVGIIDDHATKWYGWIERANSLTVDVGEIIYLTTPLDEGVWALGDDDHALSYHDDAAVDLLMSLTEDSPVEHTYVQSIALTQGDRVTIERLHFSPLSDN